MTPVALLVAFCAAMAAIAIGRLAVDNSRDCVDIGSALVVVGITLLTALWISLEESLLGTTAWVLLAIVGGGTGCLGVILIVRYWDEIPEPTASCD